MKCKLTLIPPKSYIVAVQNHTLMCSSCGHDTKTKTDSDTDIKENILYGVTDLDSYILE